MQSFATGPNARVPNTGASERVLIEGNRCERIDNQCLIVEGPFSSYGDGSRDGRTSDVTFRENYCDAHASQAVWLDDVRRPTIEHNEIADGVLKAFAMTNNCSGGTVGGNTIGSHIRYQISMDQSSRIGYRGPEPEGLP
jgi:hypothetical protein